MLNRTENKVKAALVIHCSSSYWDFTTILEKLNKNKNVVNSIEKDWYSQYGNKTCLFIERNTINNKLSTSYGSLETCMEHHKECNNVSLITAEKFLKSITYEKT